MRFESKRLTGAVVFAVLFSMIFSTSQLLGEGSVDIASFAGSLLATGVVAYLAWPGLDSAWKRRDPTEDGKRLLMIGFGLLLGFVLVQAMSFIGGGDDAVWSFVLLVVTLAAVFGAEFVQVRRARRP